MYLIANWFLFYNTRIQFEANFPQEKRCRDYQKVRDYFSKKNKNVVTDDIILAYGRKLFPDAKH
jgi:hypothetical protein